MSLSKPVIFETTFTSYTGTDIIGKGGAGCVYRATDDAENMYAIKLLDAAKANREKVKRFKNEVEFSLKNRHQNIITVIDHGGFIDGKQLSPFYVMPLYQGSLRTLLVTGIPPDKVLFYFAQLLDGVEAAHLQKVIHRDLKPENVLYDEAQNRLVIADFGIARFEEEALYTAVETARNERLANFQYAAPEQRSRGAHVGYRTDIYALGLILNEMIGRKQEFVTRQRLSELKRTVVPITDLDDPLIIDPPQLVDFEYERGVLYLFLKRPVDEKWVYALRNMRSTYSSLQGKGPEQFHFSGDTASIRAAEHDVQQIIDYFKMWLPMANREYEQTIRREQQEEEERQRQELQKEIEEQERRQRVRANVRI